MNEPSRSGTRPTDHPRGDLGARPLAVILAAAAERGVSGTLSLAGRAGSATITLEAGKIADVTANDATIYLGGILYEQGAIDAATLDATLRVVAEERRLHGTILLERGLVTRVELAEALVEQLYRKVNHVFGYPGQTMWQLRERPPQARMVARLDLAVERPPIDTWRAIWRALRDLPLGEHVVRSLATLGGTIQLRDARVADRLGCTPDERAVAARLAASPMTVSALTASTALAQDRVCHLVYALGLTRTLVRVRTEAPGPADLGRAGVVARARAIADEDAYAVLGLPRGAPGEAVRAAFFRLAKLWHPNKLPPELEDVRAECETVFSRILEAQRTLTERVVDGPASAPPEAPPTLAAIDRALAAGDLVGAAALARPLAVSGNEGPEARAVIAWCDSGAGQGAESGLRAALAALDRVLASDPDCKRALVYHARVARRLGATDVAVRDYRRVLRLDPNDHDAARELRLFEMRSRGDDDGGSGLRRLLAKVAGK